jgi:transposase-like protein
MEFLVVDGRVFTGQPTLSAQPIRMRFSSEIRKKYEHLLEPKIELWIWKRSNELITNWSKNVESKWDEFFRSNDVKIQNHHSTVSVNCSASRSFQQVSYSMGMTPTKVPSEILPTDSRGRVRMSRQRREELLDEFERSGMTGAQFARTIGLKYQTFAFWRQQRQKRKPALANSSPQKTATVEWLETVIDKANTATPFRRGTQPN